MKVMKSWVHFKPRLTDSKKNYQAVIVVEDEELGKPSKGYGTPLKTVERLFKTRRTAKRWIDIVKKSVNSEKPIYPLKCDLNDC